MFVTLLVAILAAPAGSAGPTLETALLKAAAARDAVAVREMLEKSPALANARSEDGTTAVSAALFAIRKGEESFPDAATNAALQAILARSPRLDVFDIAAVGAANELAALLQAEPSTLTKRNRFGWTLLHLSAYAGNTATTKLLLEKGAEVNARAETKFRNTPLQTALLSGQYATARLLLEHGADALVRQSKGFTPMHEAAFLGRQDLVQLLLDHGAEINSRSDDGKTPLAEAVRGHREELTPFLKSKGALIEPAPGEEPPKK